MKKSDNALDLGTALEDRDGLLGGGDDGQGFGSGGDGEITRGEIEIDGLSEQER